MTEYYKIWKWEAGKWVGQGTLTSGGWMVKSAGKYKTNKCTNGFWATPETHTITDEDMKDRSAFGSTYIAHGAGAGIYY